MSQAAARHLLVDTVFSAPLNEVQGPVKTQFGYHLLEVTARD